jgi:chaperonin GroEL
MYMQLSNNGHTDATRRNTQDIVEDVMMDVRDAVVATMGPNGKLSAITVGTSVKVTKDGVTVAKSLKFVNPFEEAVNRIITEPAVKTDVECGDGTTTTILLTSELYRLYSQFPNYRERKFIDMLGNKIIDQLSRMSITVTNDSPELYNLALTSSNGDEALATVITNIYHAAGDKYPEIELKEGLGGEDQIVTTDGLLMNLIYSNPSFSKNGNGTASEFTDFYPIVIDDNIRNVDPQVLGPMLKQLLDRTEDSAGTFLLIARSFDNAINSMILQINNQLKRPAFICAQTNFGGSVGTLLMQDLSVQLNANMVKVLSDIVFADLNKCQDHLTIGSTRSVFVPSILPTIERIARQVESIEQELNSYERGERFSMRARFNEKRLRDLKGELVTVFVGGETQSEIKERIDRFEDVSKAVKSALVNGILPGVGSALVTAGMFAISELSEEDEKDPVFAQIIEVMEEVVFSQYILLMGDMLVPVDIPVTKRLDALRRVRKQIAGNVMDMDHPNPIPAVNLRDNTRGSPRELGIFDTAYASITALRGGMATAKTLASLDSILIGDKLAAVNVQS